MMDFTLPESAQAVAALAAEVLAEPDPWKTLARTGLLDATSLGVLETTVLLTEIGRRRPCLKALATLMTGALPIARWGSDQLKQELLPGVASGELLLTSALREPSDPQPDPPATTITDGKLTGTKVGVPYAEQSRLVLVPTSMIMGRSGQIAPKKTRDHGVALLNPCAPGVALTRTPSSSGEPEYTLRMDRAPIEGVLGGADCVRDLYQLAVAGACALADGAVAGALALTRDHVATREQFGRPLAACWRLDAGLEAGPEMGAALDVAGYWCAEQAPRTVRICHHLHGGLGMDVTYPLHRFSSLVADLVRYLGGAEYRLERLACSST